MSSSPKEKVVDIFSLEVPLLDMHVSQRGVILRHTHTIFLTRRSSIFFFSCFFPGVILDGFRYPRSVVYSASGIGKV